MSNYKLADDEVLLYCTTVIYDDNEDILFSLTNKNLIFEKVKGIVKKNLKVIKKIGIDKIKVYKNNVQIKQRDNKLIIQTIDEKIEFSLSNKIEAKKLMNQIIHIKTGDDLANRTAKKITSFIGEHKAVIALTSAVVGYALSHREEITELLSSINIGNKK